MNMQVMNCRRFECVILMCLCLHTEQSLSVHAVQVVVLNVCQVGAQMQFECPMHPVQQLECALCTVSVHCAGRAGVCVLLHAVQQAEMFVRHSCLNVV